MGKKIRGVFKSSEKKFDEKVLTFPERQQGGSIGVRDDISQSRREIRQSQELGREITYVPHGK